MGRRWRTAQAVTGIEPTEAHAIARKFRAQIGGAYEAVAVQIEHDHPLEKAGDDQ